MELSDELHLAATAAFRDNSKLALMTPEECEAAAQFYEQVARQTVGMRSAVASLYNQEHTRFLRGEVPRIAPSAPLFARERGLS